MFIMVTIPITKLKKYQRVELQQRAFENQQDYIRQQERFIERFKAKASKAAMPHKAPWNASKSSTASKT